MAEDLKKRKDEGATGVGSRGVDIEVNPAEAEARRGGLLMSFGGRTSKRSNPRSIRGHCRDLAILGLSFRAWPWLGNLSSVPAPLRPSPQSVLARDRLLVFARFPWSSECAVQQVLEMSSVAPTVSSPCVRSGVEADESDPSADPERREESEAPKGGDKQGDHATEAPPLPSEPVPPLPSDAPPDDGWDPVWDDSAQAYYFYNRFTQATQWENPRVPDAVQAPGVANHDRIPESAPGTEDAPAAPQPRPYGGYDPAIHGDYDPDAPYAQEPTTVGADASAATTDPAGAYEAVGGFNRWTGRWQNDSVNPENHNDENKSKRQMNAFFDVDAAANSHNGRSLKAERSGKKLSKQELKAFKEKRKEKKEEKRRAWLRD